MNGYARHNLILKVFSGPHVGAEVILRNGEHTIGSSDACDVILHDRLIAPRHARLLISEGRVQCDRLDDAVLMIDGKPQESAVLAPFQYFTLGNTHLAIGPADQPWPAMSFPDFKLRQMGPSLETPPVESKPVAGQKVRTSRSSRRKYYWAMMAAAILMMIAAVGFPVWPSRAPISDAQTLNAAHLQHRLAETIAECAPGSIVDIQFENGRCCVRGYVDNAEQQPRLQRRLPDICPNVRLRLWNSDQLVRAAAEVLAAGGLALNAAKGAPGEVVIRGAVSHGKCWADVQRRLRRDRRLRVAGIDPDVRRLHVDMHLLP